MIRLMFILVKCASLGGTEQIIDMFLPVMEFGAT